MGTIITILIWAILALLLCWYIKKGKSCGHVPDFRKPIAGIAFAIATVIMVIVLACSSCTSTKYVPVETTRYVKTTETLRDTTLIVQLVPSKETTVIFPGDTISHLSNKYADSWVRIKNGYMSHSLEILPADVPVKATVKDKATVDSIRIPVPYPVAKTICKDKELNWYQNLCIWGFSILLGILAIGVVCLAIKIRLNGIQSVFKWFSNNKK